MKTLSKGSAIGYSTTTVVVGFYLLTYRSFAASSAYSIKFYREFIDINAGQNRLGMQ